MLLILAFLATVVTRLEIFFRRYFQVVEFIKDFQIDCRFSVLSRNESLNDKNKKSEMDFVVWYWGKKRRR